MSRAQPMRVFTKWISSRWPVNQVITAAVAEEELSCMSVAAKSDSRITAARRYVISIPALCNLHSSSTRAPALAVTLLELHRLTAASIVQIPYKKSARETCRDSRATKIPYNDLQMCDIIVHPRIVPNHNGPSRGADLRVSTRVRVRVRVNASHNGP